MKKYDMDIDKETILDSIKKDYLKRNSKLNKFIDIINSIDEKRVLVLDGQWGTGKTIFVHQIIAINENNIEDFVDSNKNIFMTETINIFKDKYVPYYYNAWENDLHESPLLSLIYNLINDFPTEKKQTANGKIQLPFNLKELLKTISGNAIDLEKVESFEDITSEIHTAEEKRNALNIIINNIVPEGKRLLFIIDEMDRCKPTFSVNMLETIKHFFNNEKITFLLVTNNEQLSHVITNYYGANFDGYSYLNKFYDLIIELDEINVVDYLQNKFGQSKTSRYYDYSLFSISQYFRFSMREINRLLSDFDFLSKYFQTSYGGIYKEDLILKYIFLPYCLAMKINDRKGLTQFLNGDGYDNLEKFVTSMGDIKRILQYDVNNNRAKDNNEEFQETEIIEFLKNKYEIYFKSDISLSENYEYKTSKQKFIDTFSLLGNYTEIQKKDD